MSKRTSGVAPCAATATLLSCWFIAPRSSRCRRSCWCPRSLLPHPSRRERNWGTPQTPPGGAASAGEAADLLLVDLLDARHGVDHLPRRQRAARRAQGEMRHAGVDQLLRTLEPALRLLQIDAQPHFHADAGRIAAGLAHVLVQPLQQRLRVLTRLPDLAGNPAVSHARHAA